MTYRTSLTASLFVLALALLVPHTASAGQSNNQAGSGQSVSNKRAQRIAARKARQARQAARQAARRAARNARRAANGSGSGWGVGGGGGGSVAAPELDANVAGTAGMLVVGGLLVLTGRRRRVVK